MLTNTKRFIYYETDFINFQYIFIRLIMDPTMQSAAELKKIFDSFDTDKSGSIDLKQLGSVASKLGKEIPAEELTAIMKKLDANKDGKISFGEFEYWWTRGVEGKMMELVFFKAKSMKMTNFIKKKADKFNFAAKAKPNAKPDILDFRVHFGSFVPDAISLDVGLYIHGQKEAELRKRIAELGPKITDNSFGFVFKLNSSNPSEAKAAIDHALNSMIKSEAFPIPVENIQKNPFFGYKTYVREKELILQITFQIQLQNVISPVASQAQQIMSQAGEGFYSNIDFSFSLNSSFDSLFEEAILVSFLKGFNFHLKLEVNNSALGNLRKFLQQQQVELPTAVKLITLIRCAKFHLGIRSPQQLSSFFKKLGIAEMVGGLPSIKDIFEQLSPAIRQATKEKSLQFIHQFSRYLAKHIENEVQIYVLGSSIGAGFIRAQGKNASKIHSMLFNQVV